MADESPTMKNVDEPKQLKTGITELDDMLSGNIPLRDLHIFTADVPIKTNLELQALRAALEKGTTAATFDFEMAPEFGPEDMGIEPPDDPITPKPGS